MNEVLIDGIWLIALMIIGVLLLVLALFAIVARIRVWVIYLKYNKVKNSEGLTAKESAEKFKNIVGLQNVKVEQCSWWRALFSLGGPLGFGNNYSIYKKTIFLRKNIIDKPSITAVGIATQKVGLALQDKEGNKLYRFTARVKPFLFLAPVLVLPVIIIGVIIDFITIQKFGYATIISSFSSGLVYFLTFLIILFTIKVEKKANKQALELMEKENFLTPEERKLVKKIYDAYILLFIAEFVIALFELIRYILKVLRVVNVKAKKK